MLETGQFATTRYQQSGATPVILSRIETKRTLEVVDLFEAIDIWEKKIKELSEQLRQLKGGKQPTVTIDDGRLSQLQQELSNAYEQIQNAQKQKRQLEHDQRDLRDASTRYDETIRDLLMRIEDREQTVQDHNQTIEDLRRELDEGQETTVQKTTYLTSEVNVWKNKFKTLEVEFAQAKEELKVAEKDLADLRKKKAQK